MKKYKYLLMFAVSYCVTACAYTNHFLDEEEEPEVNTYSTLKDINNTAYDTWTYINLQTGEIETHPDASEWVYSGDGSLREAQAEEEIGIDWHIAIHRYEIKTNGASVLNTGKTDMLEVTELPDGTYMPDYVAVYEEELKKNDETQYILVMDMSGMMSGNIGYAHRPTINKILCDGVTRTATGSMPPTIYGTTEEVFALKWDDGNWATLQITDTYSSTSASGYMSLNYKYHLAE